MRDFARRRAFLAATAALAVSARVRAQPAPAKAPIRLIVPAPTGGSADLVGRIVARALAGILEVDVDVVNVPGNGGVTGITAMAASPNDGSVLGLAISTPLIGGKLLSRSAHFNPIEDFDWLAILGTYSNAMIVSRRTPAEDIVQWLAYARRSNVPLVYASFGTGSAGHLAGAYLRVDHGLRMIHRTLERLDEGYALLSEGKIDVLFDGVPNASTAVRGGEHLILAVTSATRAERLPAVPSFGELWQRRFEVFVGLVAPRGLPPPVYFRLAPAVGVLLYEPVHAAHLRDAGLTYLGLSGRGTRSYIEGEFLRNASLIAALNDEGVRN